MVRRKTQQEAEEIYAERGFKLLSKYKNNRTPNEVLCPNGHFWNTGTLSSFQKGWGCPHCSNHAKLTYEFVKESFEKEGYILLSTEYINAQQKLEYICPNGHNHSITWGHWQSGERCPECKNSLGERKVEEFLKNHNLSYDKQYSFEDCKYKYVLKFDFIVYINDNKFIMIEFDGEQHFRPKERYGGLWGFVDVVIRDTIKNIYCEQNNIKLIRISYKDMKRIEEILIKELDIK